VALEKRHFLSQLRLSLSQVDIRVSLFSTNVAVESRFRQGGSGQAIRKTHTVFLALLDVMTPTTRLPLQSFSPPNPVGSLLSRA